MMAVPRIRQVAARSTEIPEAFELAKIHSLRVYAAATWHAYVQSLTVNASLVDGLRREATECRATLLMYADALAEHGWIRKRPGRMGTKAGMQALAHDVLDLAERLSEAWPRIQAVGIEGWHLVHASAIGLDLLIVRSVRSHVPDPHAEQTCARALSVFAYAYDECRELVRRWKAGDEDLEEIAPSIGVLDRDDEDENEDGASEGAAQMRAGGGLAN